MENNYKVNSEFYSVEEDIFLYDSERDFTILKAW